MPVVARQGGLLIAVRHEIEGAYMHTVYDWLTVALFGGLIVLFLQRSSQETHTDHLWQYIPPALGCALANYLGNEGYALAAIAVLVATAAYVIYVLKPFPPLSR